VTALYPAVATVTAGSSLSTRRAGPGSLV